MSDQEFGNLAEDIGGERTSELRGSIASFLRRDDEQGFYKWRATLPEYERQYVHELANRTRTARAGDAPIQMHATRAPDCIEITAKGKEVMEQHGVILT